MSQLLIVQGPTPEAALPLFRQAVEAFDTLCHLRPIADKITNSGAVAVFPPARKPGIPIVESESGPGWVGGVGAWFYEGYSGEPGLRRLAANPRRTSRPDLWLADIDGSFAIATEGVSPDELLVITDRLGILHVYQAEIRSCIVISTSLLVLACLSQAPLDPVACREFLSMGIVFDRHSLFTGIDNLAPATILHFSQGRLLRKSVYWDITACMYDRVKSAGTVPEMAEALQRSVATISRNFPRPVLDLSGGLDSRAVLAAMLSRELSFDTVVNGEDDDRDVVASKRIAQTFGLRQVQNRRTFSWDRVQESLALTDGEANVLRYAATLGIHNRLADEFDASVNGCFGEISKHHWWDGMFAAERPFDAAALANRRLATAGEISGLLSFPFPESLADFYAALVRRTTAAIQDRPASVRTESFYISVVMQRWQGRLISATSRIWPCISPFTFREPLEVALSMPPAVRFRCRMMRRLIAFQNPKLASLPLEKGCPALPLRLTTAYRFWPAIAESGKAAIGRLRRQWNIFPPRPTWAASSYPVDRLWREGIQELLDPSRMATAGIYNQDVLRRTLQEWRQPSSSGASRLGLVLTLELLGRAVQRKQCYSFR